MKIRFLFVLLPFLTAMTGLASAQVAAPSLVPGAPDLRQADAFRYAGFVSANPAAMQWGAPSHIGAGAVRTSRKNTAGVKHKFEGNYGGARGVWEYVALAAETQSLRDKVDERKISEEATAYGAAVKAASWLALGASQDAVSRVRKGPTTTTDNVTDHTFQRSGASLRFGEMLFLGATTAQNRKKFVNKLNSAKDTDQTRTLVQYGIGLRGGGALAYHLEAFKTEGTNFVAANNGAFQRTTTVAEVNWNGILLAYRGAKHETPQGDGYDHVRLSAGWAPAEGFSVVAHQGSSEEVDTNGDKRWDHKAQAVTLAWMF